MGLKILVTCMGIGLLSGCVTMGKFRSKEDEARRYQDEVADLARRHQSTLAILDSTTVDLTANLSARRGLELDTTQLHSTVASLRARNADLAGVLRASNAEKDFLIAAMTQARQDQDSTIGVLRYALSAAGDERARLTSEVEALGVQSASSLAEAEANYQDLVAGLQDEIEQGQIIITSLQNRLTVNIVDQVLFESGEAQVKRNGRLVLENLARVLRTISAKQIQIEGHTDNVPISRRLQSIYPSNWELSSARATHVARLLIEEMGIDPRRVSVAGFGEFRPVATNTSEEGRRRNRRIEVVLLPYEEPPFVEVPARALAPADSLAVPADSLLAPPDTVQVPADSTAIE